MEELTGLDARFLYSETPTAHMHTLKIAVIDLAGRAEALSPMASPSSWRPGSIDCRLCGGAHRSPTDSGTRCR